MKGIGRKSLVSIVTAGLLSTAAIAAGNGVFDADVKSIKISCDTTSVPQNGTLHCAINLFNKDGKPASTGVAVLDTAKSKITIVPEDGKVNPATIFLGDANASYEFNVSNFKGTGADSINAVALLIDGDGDSKVIEAKTYNINVTSAINNAYYLKVEDIQNASGESGENFKAGEQLYVTVKAYDKYGKHATYQNSEVTLKLYKNKKVVYTTTAPMQGGVANIEIPADTVIDDTATYYVVVSTPTEQDPTKGARDVNKDGAVKHDKIADNYYDYNQDKIIKVEALSDFDHVKFKLTRETNNTFNIKAKAVDQYGNKLEQLSDQVKVKCELSYGGNSKSGSTTLKDDSVEKSITIQNAASLVYNNNDWQGNDDGTAEATISCKVDGEEKFTKDVTLYEYVLRYYPTRATDVNNTTLYVGKTYNINSNDVNFTVYIKDGTGNDINISRGDANATNLKLELLDNGDNIVDTYSNVDTTASYVKDYNSSDVNGTVPFKFTKTVHKGKIRVSGTLIDATNNNEYKLEPVTIEPIEVNSSKLKKAIPVKIEPADDLKKVSAIEISDQLLEKFKKDNNASLNILSYNYFVVNDKTKYTYFESNESGEWNGANVVKPIGYIGLKFVDEFGNLINSNETDGVDANVTIKESTLFPNNPTLPWYKYHSEANKSINLELEKTIKFEPGTFGSENTELSFKTKYYQDTLKEIKLYTSDDYIIKGAIVPITVESIGDNLDKVYIYVSAPDKIKVLEANNTIRNNGDKVGKNTEDSHTFYIKGVTSGEVTLTFKNTAGNVKAEKKFNVVGSLNDIPGAIPMSIDKSQVTLNVDENVKVTVSNADGDISVSSSNPAVATATVSGNVVTIQAQAAGTAQITISDKDDTLTVSVTVKEAGTQSNPIQAVENAIVSASPVAIDGYFIAHDFGNDGSIDYNDWVYKVKASGNTYRLLGTAPSDNNPFGWVKVNVSVDETQANWLMSHYGSGRYDWVVYKPDCSAAYKLAGATAQGTFTYDVDGDGTQDKLGITCTISNGQVTFRQQ